MNGAWQRCALAVVIAAPLALAVVHAAPEGLATVPPRVLRRGVPVSTGAATNAARRTFDAAVAHGDPQRADRIARTLGISSRLVALYNLQFRYRLQDLAHQAKRCRGEFHARGGGHSDPPSAVVEGCAALWLETNNSRGDARGVFDALAWLRRAASQARGAVAQASSGHFKPYSAALAGSIPVYSSRVATPAPVVLRYVHPGTTVPTTHGSRQGDRRHQWRENSKGSSRLFVQAAINGHLVNVSVDTGQSIPLSMSASEAAKLHLRYLAPGYLGFRTALGPAVPSDQIGLWLAPSVKFGSLRLHNVLVHVLPSGYNHTPKRLVTVGFPLLANFKSVTFRRSELGLNASHGTCAHPLAMTYATKPGAYALPVFAITVDGRVVKALMDTGANIVLVGKELSANATTDGHGRRHGGVPWRVTGFRYLAVQLGSVAFNDADVAMVRQMLFPDVVIGRPVLGAAAVRIAFKPAMSICFIAQHRAGGRP